MRLLALAVGILLVTAPGFLPAQTSSPSPIFTIKSDEFWLNLHHFLYVLGRAQANMPDASRAAVVDAPVDAARGRAGLSEEEQAIWTDAVAAYAVGLSRKDAVFDDPLPTTTVALASADDQPTLANISIDSDARSVLDRAAAVYRKAWWPAHRAANRAWQSSMESLLNQHGQTILRFSRPRTGCPGDRVAIPRMRPRMRTGRAPIPRAAAFSWSRAVIRARKDYMDSNNCFTKRCINGMGRSSPRCRRRRRPSTQRCHAT
jgi:hypothetical protein